MTRKCIRITWLSNVMFEPYLRTSITHAFPFEEYDVQLNHVMYEEVNDSVSILQNSDIIVVHLWIGALYPHSLNELTETKYAAEKNYKDICERNRALYCWIKTNSEAKIIWFGFEDYFTKGSLLFGSKYGIFGFIDKVNLFLCELLTDDVFIDLKRIIAECGILNSYNDKGKYRWNSPYSQELIKLMSGEVCKQYLINTGRTKKCIVLDCDNVLWGGVLSEDGMEGIKLAKNGFGSVYHDFQSFVYTLYKHGVILAICSKNDLSNVLQVFRDHSEMVLKEKYISCFMVNWENKPSNIERIAEYLNIGLDSIVFVDDSLVEIECVRSLLPEVTTIRFSKYMDYAPFSCFNLKSEYNLDDVERRTRTYQTNSLRINLKRSSIDCMDYVQSLNVVVDIHKALPIEFSRISELTMRTNKCTNGRRYTIEEIKERACKPNVTLYSVSVSDMFSDLGLVGAMEIENDHLTLFSLSCRALGREVEDTMFDYLLSNHQIKSYDYLLTNKNVELQKLLLNNMNLNMI